MATDELELKSLKKTYWRERETKHWVFFCPLCRTQRALPFRPRPGGILHVSQVGITAVFFTLLTWDWFTWKGLVAFVPFWAVFELIYRARVRGALSCTNCGFDPYLYKIDVNRARQEIQEHWKKKFAEKGIPFPGLTESDPQG